MDGVIVDSRTVIEQAWRQVVEHHGDRELTDIEVHEHVHGRTGSHTVAALFPDHSPEQRREIWADVDRLEESAPYEMIPGVRDLLAGLTAHGVPIGLVTSGWPAKIDHVLSLLGLPEPFVAVVSRDDVGHGKPHPEPYLKGCAAVGVPPGDTLVFEDALSGVRSAVAAGTRCVGVGSAELVDAGAFTVAPDFTGIRVEAAPGGLTLTGVEPAQPVFSRQ